MFCVFVAALAVICFTALSTNVSAQDIDDNYDPPAAGEPLTGPRTAKCLIEVQGTEYLRDFCSFLPSNQKDGSFTIAEYVINRSVEAKVILSSPGSKVGVAYWSGPSGGRTDHELGPAHSEGACWRVGDVRGKAETRLCAWSTPAVDQPAPKAPPADTKDFVYYGMRVGMYDAIDSRDQIDTDFARIVTKKNRDAAILRCRSNGDFTAECIESTLREVPTPILTANCVTGTFAYALALGDCNHCKPPQTLKFLGANPHSEEGADFLIQNNSLGETTDGSWASTYQFALDAYSLLCPKTLARARPVRR